ncbi:M23 family metallopeptidase [Kordia sp. YSTF-M3]|uniref:M23 family metallopeptidase n=1 Tax=Kordia aestuariivivens TaxID=2759037 RepID=A0ABR7Q4X1_9FLAO|nr:M23 family metallopeptidase [Kordia aestuariivivens]MBC8753553.1 M23 family metallopeptidase [Kordia aestuariivivens]
MKLVVGFLFLLLSINTNAQKKAVEVVKIYKENIVYIHLKNNTNVNYSAELNIHSGYNYEKDKETPLLTVLAPKEQKLLVTVTRSTKKKSDFSTSFTYVVGNVNAKHNDKYVYDLPYAKGSSFSVNQGYNGSFSHKGQNFLDFTMPVNTPIHAIRDGIVIKVKKDSRKGCPTISCVDDGNYIWIEHDDGTIAEYVHLRYRGTALKLGNRVKKGQKIAFSGNTGFSQAPHLHMGVFINQVNGERITIPIKFNVDNSTAIELKKGDSYVKQ